MDLRLGNYVCEEVIGEGAFGRVYRARQLTMDRPVALKVLHRRVSADPTFVEAFQREARLAAQLNHPNIVTIIDVGSEGGYHYFSMALIEGRNLAQVIKEDGPVPPERARGYMVAVARALVTAHAQGVVHRDIKPSNLFLDAGGRLLLGDFGVARTGGEEDGAWPVVGTPHYMAPEQFLGRAGDERSDLYSLGASFFAIVSGALPYGGPINRVKEQHLRAPVPSLAERCPACPPALSRIVTRLLQKDPRDRFPSAAELLAALERRRAGAEAVRTRRGPARHGRRRGRIDDAAAGTRRGLRPGPSSRPSRRPGEEPESPSPWYRRPRFLMPAVAAGALGLIVLIVGVAIAAARDAPESEVNGDSTATDLASPPPPTEPPADPGAQLRGRLRALEDWVRAHPADHAGIHARYRELVATATGAGSGRVAESYAAWRRSWREEAGTALVAAGTAAEERLAAGDFDGAMVAAVDLAPGLREPVAAEWERLRTRVAERCRGRLRERLDRIERRIRSGDFAAARSAAAALHIDAAGHFAAEAERLAELTAGIAPAEAAARAARERRLAAAVTACIELLGEGRFAEAEDHARRRLRAERLGDADAGLLAIFARARALAGELAEDRRRRQEFREDLLGRPITLRTGDGPVTGVLASVDRERVVVTITRVIERPFEDGELVFPRTIPVAELAAGEAERLGVGAGGEGLSAMARRVIALVDLRSGGRDDEAARVERDLVAELRR